MARARLLTWPPRASTVLVAALLAFIAFTAVRVVWQGDSPPVVLPALAVTDPSFAPTMHAHTSVPVVAGNAVEILLNGDHIFPAKLALIRGARRTITYAEYFYAEGDVGGMLAAALAERCRAGVAVKVLLDGVGTLSMEKPHHRTLHEAGCRVVTFRPVGRFTIRNTNNRNHRRVLVADGRVGITGGSGVSWKWTGNGRKTDHWRDTDVRIEGPVVEQLQAAFAENWREATGELIGGPDYFPATGEPRGPSAAQAIRSGPGIAASAMYALFLLAISGARESILITNPYFVPDDRLGTAILDAARRGVRIAVLTPGVIDHPIVREAGRREFGTLIKAGVEIYEYQPALLHAKTMVVDGVWATIGSTNLDNRSFAMNDELNLAVYDPAVARELAKIFEEDLTHAERVTLEKWERRGFKSRAYELIGQALWPIL